MNGKSSSEQWVPTGQKVELQQGCQQVESLDCDALVETAKANGNSCKVHWDDMTQGSLVRQQLHSVSHSVPLINQLTCDLITNPPHYGLAWWYAHEARQ